MERGDRSPASPSEGMLCSEAEIGLRRRWRRAVFVLPDGTGSPRHVPGRRPTGRARHDPGDWADAQSAGRSRACWPRARGRGALQRVLYLAGSNRSGAQGATMRFARYARHHDRRPRIVARTTERPCSSTRGTLPRDSDVRWRLHFAWRSPHLERGGRHQPRDARARPFDARVRSGPRSLDDLIVVRRRAREGEPIRHPGWRRTHPFGRRSGHLPTAMAPSRSRG